MKSKHGRHKTHSTNYSMTSSLASSSNTSKFLEISEDESEPEQSLIIPSLTLSNYEKIDNKSQELNRRCLNLLSRENKILKIKSKLSQFKTLGKILSSPDNDLNQEFIHKKTISLQNLLKSNEVEKDRLREVIEEFCKLRDEANVKKKLNGLIKEKEEELQRLKDRVSLGIIKKRRIIGRKVKIDKKRKRILIEMKAIDKGSQSFVNVKGFHKYLQNSFCQPSELDTTCEKSSFVSSCTQNLNSQIKDLKNRLNELQYKVKSTRSSISILKSSTSSNTPRRSQQDYKTSIINLKTKIKCSEFLLQKATSELSAKESYLNLQESVLFDRFSLLYHTQS